MYLEERYLHTVDIRLDPGTYVFTGGSATGKTFLGHILSKLALHGEPVAYYTYADYLAGKSLLDVLSSDVYKVVLVDRYDLYSGAHDFLIGTPRNNILLIDSKSSVLFKYPNVHACDMWYTEGGVVVV